MVACNSIRPVAIPSEPDSPPQLATVMAVKEDDNPICMKFLELKSFWCSIRNARQEELDSL